MKRRWLSPLQLAGLIFILSIFIVFFLPLVMQVKRSFDTQTRRDHLGEIGLAIIKASQQKVVLSQAICSPEGRPLLSWRVAILPYLNDQEAKDCGLAAFVMETRIVRSIFYRPLDRSGFHRSTFPLSVQILSPES